MNNITASNKVYDGTTAAVLNTDRAVLAGVLAGLSRVTLDVSSAVGTFSDKNVGMDKTVTISGLTLAGPDAYKYSLEPPTTSADITPRPVTVTALADAKTYDGTTFSTRVPAVTLGDLAAGDTASWTQTFDSKAAGSSKTLTPTGEIDDGNAGGNYMVTFETNNAGVILPKPLTVRGVAALDKMYDGRANASVSVDRAELVGIIGSDNVTLNTASAAAAFEDKNAGRGKTVRISGLAIAGPDAANYSLAQPETTADIIIRPITVSGITARDKVFDGNPAAELDISRAVLAGVASTDSVNLDTALAAGAFAGENPGGGKHVTVSGLVIRGLDAANYALVQPTTTARIAAPHIQIEYDSIVIPDGATTPGEGDGTDFGRMAVAGGNIERVYTIRNTGDAPLILGGSPPVNINGAPADFTVVTMPSTAVAGGGSTTFAIRFNPSAAGLHTAAVSIASNDRNHNHFTFTIQGTGDASKISLVSPHGGEDWKAGAGHAITWSAINVAGGVTIDLLRAGNKIRSLAPSIESGAISYLCVVPPGLPPGSDYQVMIASTGKSTISGTSENFSISAPNETGVPRGGEIRPAKTPLTTPCSNCGREITQDLFPSGVKFCPFCGEKTVVKEPAEAVRFCPHCGERLVTRVVFCPKCRKRVVAQPAPAVAATTASKPSPTVKPPQPAEPDAREDAGVDIKTRVPQLNLSDWWPNTRTVLQKFYEPLDDLLTRRSRPDKSYAGPSKHPRPAVIPASPGKIHKKTPSLSGVRFQPAIRVWQIVLASLFVILLFVLVGILLGFFS